MQQKPAQLCHGLLTSMNQSLVESSKVLKVDDVENRLDRGKQRVERACGPIKTRAQVIFNAGGGAVRQVLQLRGELTVCHSASFATDADSRDTPAGLRLSRGSEGRSRRPRAIRSPAVNRHLSIFRPYQHMAAGHEDQLTRAALITMQLVPLAHEAFLRLAGCPALAELPAARFDMQTGMLAPPDTATDEPQRVTELVTCSSAPARN